MRGMESKISHLKNLLRIFAANQALNQVASSKNWDAWPHTFRGFAIVPISHGDNLLI